jgi:RsiW-degrading membrane proteinase PrsW (M82 family)
MKPEYLTTAFSLAVLLAITVVLVYFPKFKRRWQAKVQVVVVTLLTGGCLLSLSACAVLFFLEIVVRYFV